MNWYIKDLKNGELIDGPYESRDEAFDKFTAKLEDDEWLTSAGINIQENDEHRDWWVSGWKPVPEWYGTAMDNPKRNPETTRYIQNVRYGFSLGFEYTEDGYYVGVFDETDDSLIEGTECGNFREALAAMLDYAMSHEQYHEKTRASVQLSNASVISEADVSRQVA